MPRVAAPLALIAALAASDCSLLHQRQQHTYALDAPLTVEDSAFLRSLDNFGSVMVKGNSAELLENGDGIFGAMFGDIREAKSTINLEIYIYRDDEAGRQVADALIEASRRGVEVRLMPDAEGSKLDTLRGELEKAGVIVKDYRPAKSYNYLGRRTHRKLLIVDGKIGYTGGFCIDKRWLGDGRAKDEWHDTAVRVTGPVVAQMQAIFGEDWTYTTGEILAGERFFPALPPTGEILAQAMKASKGDASSLPKMLYFMAIEAATTSIHIQNPYFLPDAQIRKALVAAAKRGVDVRVMVPGPDIDVPPVRTASRSEFGELLLGGVRIYEYQPTMIHSKVLVVDGLFTSIGSINFDARSMSKNAEECVSFYDRAFATTVETMFERDAHDCKEITYEAWHHRGVEKRMTELLSRLFKPLY
ncbi:MAG TPA: phospholipase D-like domain-containing protein [Candidatus Polarisedimenticolaceae bacterium]|nr:phospholipase D-like domain-containing protein [Candidatus Polarisedimenticolaceae bacterium]